MGFRTFDPLHLRDRVHRLNCCYQALSETATAILRIEEERALFAEVCRIAVERGGLLLAWVGLVDAGGQRVEVAAHAGPAGDYLRGLRISIDAALPEGRGPTGTAIREQRPVVVDDFMADPRTGPWQKAARAIGIGSSMAMPLARGGRAVGAINLYAAERGFFDAELVKLFGDMASALGFALDGLARERARSRAEAALFENEQRLRAILETVPAIVYQAKPPPLKLVFVSPAVTRLLGFAPEEFLIYQGLWRRQIHEQDLQVAINEFDTLCAVHDRFQLRYRMWNKQRDAFCWFLDSVSVERDQAGHVRRITGALSDITAQKLAEDALWRSERLYRTLIETTGTGFVVLDQEGKVVDANAEYVRLSGHRALREIQGRSVFEWTAPHELERARHELERCQREGRLASLELDLIDPAGRVTPVEKNASAVREDQGLRVLALVRDISERKRQEDLVRQAHERLQALSTRVLEVQEQERRTISRELHDEIGQTLTALKIGLERCAAEAASRQTGRLAELTAMAARTLEQVRALSLDLRPAVLDDLGLAAAVRWNLNRQSELAGFKANFTASLPPARLPAPLETACFRISQEALTNVVRHAHAAEVWVDLHTENGRLVMTMRDDGTGFDLERARSRALAQGSLGLLGMEERAALAGGSLEIRSTPGAGTEIHASFPLAAQASE
jgi:PAS domain S-box-containing protein